jgi:UDP-glucose 4-epimerase
MIRQQTGLPVVVLRTARFFPEPDDMAHAIVQSDANTKANELLYRRLTAEDAAAAHVAALAKAPELGFDIFIISAKPPFSPDDAEALIGDAPSVVARYFPDYPAVYERLGWTMFQSIDRVYDPGYATRRLGFTCKTGFGEMLNRLKATLHPPQPL